MDKKQLMKNNEDMDLGEQDIEIEIIKIHLNSKEVVLFGYLNVLDKEEINDDI